MHHLVHCKRDPYDVYIGRGSKWGNPFVIGRDGTREEVIGFYREWIRKQPSLLASLGELRGKVLGCWCAPKPCHGEVLLELLREPVDMKSTLSVRFLQQAIQVLDGEIIQIQR